MDPVHQVRRIHRTDACPQVLRPVWREPAPRRSVDACTSSTPSCATSPGSIARRQAMSLGLGPADLARLRPASGAGGGPPRGVRRPHGSAHVAPAGLGRGAVLVAVRTEPRGQRCGRTRVRAAGARRVRDPRGRRPVAATSPRPRGCVCTGWRASGTACAGTSAPPRVRYEEAVLDVAIQATDRLGTVAGAGRRVRRAAHDRSAAPHALAEGRPRLAGPGLGASRCWRTSPRAPARCWSTATRAGSSDAHGLPRGVRQASRPASRFEGLPRRGPSAVRAWSSSSTVACSTGRRRPGTATWSATLTPRSRAARPSGSPTGRSSTGRASRRTRSPRSSSAGGGGVGSVACPDCAAQSERGSFDE